MKTVLHGKMRAVTQAIEDQAQAIGQLDALSPLPPPPPPQATNRGAFIALDHLLSAQRIRQALSDAAVLPEHGRCVSATRAIETRRLRRHFERFASHAHRCVLERAAFEFLLRLALRRWDALRWRRAVARVDHLVSSRCRRRTSLEPEWWPRGSTSCLPCC